MGQYLIDNNVISNYFSRAFPESSMNFVGNLIDEIPIISVITQIEALSWVNVDKNKEKAIREFISEANIMAITPSVVSHCVAIRRGRKIKTPDAIIAATAMANDLTLVTSDLAFQLIPTLKVIDPMTL